MHELGRPLGALKAATNALREGAGDDPELRDEFLEGMEQTIVRMEPSARRPLPLTRPNPGHYDP